MNWPLWVKWLLWPLSVIYGVVAQVRVWLYAKGILKQHHLHAPVISVGNLTVGGTGKTPMVLWLAERFRDEGKRVGILSRGYRGRAGKSDEVALLHARLGEKVLFGVGKDRYAQGLELEKQGVDLFLLDDGYQHLQLARDVNILLMDAAKSLTHEYLLPAGTLREPLAEMGRADLLVFTRTETAPRTDAAIEKLQDYPVFSASTRLLGFRRLGASGPLLGAHELGEGPFYAFCGIGNPRAFFLDLQNWNIPVAAKCEFADHHRYDQRDAHELEAATLAAGARALVTTEKDAQNLAGVKFEGLPVYFAVIALSLPKEEAFLDTICAKLKSKGSVQ